MIKKKLRSIIFAICWLSLPSFAAITELQPLTFGEFALGPNDAESTLRVPYDGSKPRASYKLFPITLGQPGSFQLSAYPAWTFLMITIMDFDLTSGASQPLHVEDFTFPTIQTDADGNAVLPIGATLKTTGAGGSYGDGNYTGTMNITISW